MNKTQTSPHRESFVLRVMWDDPTRWKSWVQHPRTGETALVESLEELWQFIQRHQKTTPTRERKGLK